MRKNRHYCLLFLALTSCGTAFKDTSFLSQAETETTQVSQSEFKFTTNIDRNHSNIPLQFSFVIAFSKPVDPATLSDTSLRIVRKDTHETVPVEISLAEKSVRIFPKVQYYFDEYGQSRWHGLKPNTAYSLKISSQISDLEGNKLGKASSIDFSTVDLDFGIYWLNAQGEARKASLSQTTEFFDPSKPVLIHSAGWSIGSTIKDFGRYNAFFQNMGNSGPQNLLPHWKEKGFNVGVFLWDQFADEPNPLTVEPKIWSANERDANGVKALRYRVRIGTRLYAHSKSVSELFAEAYANALANYHGPGIRVVGHSFGNQVVTAGLHHVEEQIAKGLLPASLFPTRVAILDPFWTKGAKDYTQNLWPGELCRKYIRSFIENRNTVVEQIRTTRFVSLAGDENFDMRRMTSLVSAWPNFLLSIDQADQHMYADFWYLWSVAMPIHTENGTVVGAGASDEDIRKNMNYAKADPVGYFSAEPGSQTPMPFDDRLTTGSLRAN